MSGYRELNVWQKAMDLAVDVYKQTDSLPSQETYGLRSQIRRAAVSVPSNIAEGKARTSSGDFSRHISIAKGSLAELETQVLLSARLGYLEEENVLSILSECEEVGRMLSGLRKSLN